MESQETSRGAIADQAADWLIRLDAGRGDPDAFEAWRSADPRHAAIFAQVAAAWQKTGELRSAGLADDCAPTQPADTQRTPAPDGAMRDSPRPAITRRYALTGAAAGLASFAIGTGAYWRTMRDEAATGIGERRTIRLPDGSRIALNTNSRISWKIGDQLNIWLEQGEAAIHVAQKNAPALALHGDSIAGSINALLIGGHYNMRLLADGLRLIAFAGQARISGPTAGRDILRAGQVLSQNGAQSSIKTLSPTQIDLASAWQRGEIIFDGMTLAQALTEFNRYLPRHIELGDADLGGLRLGGRFNTDDPQGFLQALSDGFDISSRTNEQRILLFR